MLRQGRIQGVCPRKPTLFVHLRRKSGVFWRNTENRATSGNAAFPLRGAICTVSSPAMEDKLPWVGAPHLTNNPLSRFK
ncbi:hypothetical protein HUJ04_001071 [Dendroctonus ponderosae]|nr:hypothetical protein HUJ04_001071 [Dendroctonus ponderosae]